MVNEDKDNRVDVEWENRKLCRDGNCIGVIGEDGRCKECGLPYDDSLIPGEPGEIPDADNSLMLDEEDLPEDTGGDADSADDYDWDSRILCSDGSCIGVIGPDGRCKECGKKYEE